MLLENHMVHCGKTMWNACWRLAPNGFKSPTINASPILRSLSSISHLRGNRNRTSEVTKVPNNTSHHTLTRSAFPNSLLWSSFITTTSSFLPQYVPVRNYHSILRPRLHCKGCYFVWRHGRKYVECSDTPAHKQMKKLPTRKVWLEDYTRGNVNNAMIWNRDLKRVAYRHVDKTVISHNWLASRIGQDI